MTKAWRGQRTPSRRGRMLLLASTSGKRLPEVAPPRWPPEVVDLLQRLRLDLAVVCTILCTYTWPYGAVVRLERRHLDLEAGTLRLDPGKNREGRFVRLTPELRGLLAAQLAHVNDLSKRLGRVVPYLFPRMNRRWERDCDRDFTKVLVAACKRLGLKCRTPGERRRASRRVWAAPEVQRAWRVFEIALGVER